jgi:outer membrane protein
MSPYGGGVTVTQTLFNGFQAASRTRQAEGQVQSARETLRVTEQTVLLNAVTAYMNLLRDTAILDLQRRNVEVLQEQLRQTRDRFNVGEVTRTDVAQSESRLAVGGRPRYGDPSAGHDLAVQCRCRLTGGEGCRKRALSDAVLAGQRAAE